MPLLLEPAGARARERRARDRRLAPRARRGGRSRRAAGPPVGRRADGARRSRGDRGPRPRPRALHQPDHGRGAARRARIARLQTAGLEHVQLSLQAAEAATADRVGGYREGHGEEAGRRTAGARGGSALDHQRRGPPAEPGPARGHGRSGAGTRRAPAGGGPRPVLRLGPAQSRRPDADPRAARGGDRDRRALAARAARAAGDRLRDPRLLGQAARSPAWAAGAAPSSTSRRRAR